MSVTIASDRLRLDLLTDGPDLLRLSLPDGGRLSLSPPAFHLAGEVVVAHLAEVAVLAPPRPLGNGASEHLLGGALRGRPDLRLTVRVRIAPGDALLRLHYRLDATAAIELTRPGGRDHLVYARGSTAGFDRLHVVTLAAFNELTHAFGLHERELAPVERSAGFSEPGPIVALGDGRRTFLLAYEHGAAANDVFVRFRGRDDELLLEAVKGHACTGDQVGPERPYETIWLELGGVVGGVETLARAFRAFVLDRLSLRPASREAAIFSNSWAYQERVKSWQQQPYLSQMHRGRMLEEIDAAAAMGVEVFVIDTGWYAGTGDWMPSAERFPDGLRDVGARLDQRGMRLGLWFGPPHAALSSAAHAGHRDCLMAWHGAVPDPHPVWETEASQNLCLCSRWAEDFADTLARLHRELGVTCFKWDAVGQYGCSAPGHRHGGPAASHQERADRYAFLLPLALAAIVERLAEDCPQAIVDFDVTECGRAFGLAFLASGRYFLINNGPYFPNFDLPPGPDGNLNLFFRPGEARTWICRQALDYDRWIPSILTLVHYLPDDAPAKAAQWLRPGGFADSLEVNLASLVLGHNGLWGDLPAVSPAGVARIRATLDRYRRVRDAITRADPARVGVVGGSPEVHEKLSAGAGVVCVFATQPGTWQHVTRGAVRDAGWCLDPGPGGTLRVERLPGGNARITAEFRVPGARAVFFGAG